MIAEIAEMATVAAEGARETPQQLAMERAAEAMALVYESEVVAGTHHGPNYWFIVKDHTAMYRVSYERPEQTIAATTTTANVAQRKPAEALIVTSVEGMPAEVTVAMVQRHRHVQ